MKNFLAMALHNVLGKDGESVAIAYLKEKGYRILHTNWRQGYFEIDIIARTDDELVFIEVKTRSSRITNPEDAVNNQKIRHLISAADCYIKYFNVDLPFRFDIISIISEHNDFEIDHIEDAFYPPVNIRRW